MWPGPYGEWGSRKYLLASLDQSLKRMGLDYVDIFYSHRFDPDTPLEETMGALDTVVRQGKALYAGISSYSPEKTRARGDPARSGTPCLIHQPSYSMLNRWVEDGLLDVLGDSASAASRSRRWRRAAHRKILDGVPEGSRGEPRRLPVGAAPDAREPRNMRALAAIAQRRGQSLAQMAIAWVLRDPRSPRR